MDDHELTIYPYIDSIPIVENKQKSKDTTTAEKTTTTPPKAHLDLPPPSISAIPDYLSTSPVYTSPLSPLPHQEHQQSEGYFDIPTASTTTTTTAASVPDTSSPATTTAASAKYPCQSSNSASSPRSPMKYSPRPVHVSRISTHAVPRTKAAKDKQRRRQHRKLKLDDFILKRTVGTGSFGRVHLAQSKVNGKHYAIKALDKYDVVRLKQVEHINNEPTILKDVTHPFLVTLWDAFQDDTHLFMVMDYVPGGELFSILRKHKVRFTLLLIEIFRLQFTNTFFFLSNRNLQNKVLVFTPPKLF